MKKQKASGRLHQMGEKINGMRMNICGCSEADIEGCVGIVEYGSECIKLNAGRYIVSFRGRSLRICCMNELSLMIRGHILSIEYIM